MLNKFRILSLIEGSSLLILLFIAMPAKYQFDMPTAVTIVGSVHGALFLAYLVMSLMVSHQQNWSIIKWLGVFLAGVVPFGCFVVERQLRNETPMPA